LSVADLNGDGAADVVVADDYGQALDVFLAQGKGQIAGFAALAVGGQTDGVTIADLNGDGHLDLIGSTFTNGELTLLYGKGDGTFDPPIRIGGTWVEGGVATADLDGDGVLDMVAGSTVLQLFLGCGVGIP
jgi:hypothetical protein